MKKKVTIQNIADALGISRNTVSKAINNSEGIADSTRDLVLQKATEMGYKSFSYLQVAQNNRGNPSSASAAPGGPTEIALFTSRFLNNSHFASTMLDRIQKDLSLLGYTLNTHRLTHANRDNLTLPITFSRERTAAIICVEVFTWRYAEMICDLGLPVLFIDGPAKTHGEPFPADQLMMDNASGVSHFVMDMLDHGIRRIGFVGDYTHCQSFMERYCGFRFSMDLGNVPVDERFILKTQSRDEIERQLKALDEFPEVFICANDFIALDVMQLLTDMGLSIPKDIGVCGFDDSAESSLISPKLTTVHIHTQGMAFNAVQLLVTRIKEPSLDFRTVYAESELIYRESTINPGAGTVS